MDVSYEQFDMFIHACVNVGFHGLTNCSSGNLSWRVDDEHMLISASRAWLSDVSNEEVAVCRISEGECINGLTPSAETAFHAGILRRRPDVSVVLHFQTPFATTLACGDLESVNYNVIPEIPYYIGPVGVVPYLPPGSPELAAAVIDTMQTHDMAMMVNHGQVTVGTSFKDVIQKACLFELACEIIVHGGGRARPMSDEDIAHLRKAAEQRDSAS